MAHDLLHVSTTIGLAATQRANRYDCGVQYDPGSHSVFSRLVAILRLRCPRCCKGRVWRRPFHFNAACPVCGLRFEREAGYFTGAMYASYTISLGLTFPVWMTMLLSGASLLPTLVVAIALVVGLAPVSFHYSRVAWLHIDCHFNPHTFESDSGA